MAPDTTLSRIKGITITLDVDDPESDLDLSIELEHQEVLVLEPLIRLVRALHPPAERKIE